MINSLFYRIYKNFNIQLSTYFSKINTILTTHPDQPVLLVRKFSAPISTNPNFMQVPPTQNITNFAPTKPNTEFNSQKTEKKGRTMANSGHEGAQKELGNETQNKIQS